MGTMSRSEQKNLKEERGLRIRKEDEEEEEDGKQM